MATSESTGYTPAYLNMGCELIPSGSLAQKAGFKARAPIEIGLKRLAKAALLARTKLAQSFQKQRRYYDLRRHDWSPTIGEEVFCKTHFLSRKADNINAKLCEKYEGPYTVIRKSSPVILDLKDERGKIIRHIHVKDLKPSKVTAEV